MVWSKQIWTQTSSQGWRIMSYALSGHALKNTRCKPTRAVCTLNPSLAEQVESHKYLIRYGLWRRTLAKALRGQTETHPSPILFFHIIRFWSNKPMLYYSLPYLPLIFFWYESIWHKFEDLYAISTMLCFEAKFMFFSNWGSYSILLEHCGLICRFIMRLFSKLCSSYILANWWEINLFNYCTMCRVSHPFLL